MIDNIFIPSSVHVVLGILVMLGTLAATIVTAVLAFRRQGVTPTCLLYTSPSPRD